MADISHTFGADLSLSATGDLLCVTGDTLTQQRVLRRLLTNAGDYIWQLCLRRRARPDGGAAGQCHGDREHHP